MPPPPYVVGDSSPFLKRVIIPFWVIRILIMVLELGACGLVVAAITIRQDELESDFAGTTVKTAIAIVAVGMTLVMLIYASIIYHRFRKGDLNPGAGGDGYVKAVNPAINHGFYAEDTAYASQAYATQAEPSAQKYPASPYNVGVAPVEAAATTQYPKPTYYDAPVHGGQQYGYELESRNP